MRRSLSLWKCGALALWLGSASVEAGGVTVITHGFDSGVGEWVIPMAGQMAVYDGTSVGETTCYVLTVSSTSGPATVTWKNDVKPNLSESGEIFIKLEWSDIDHLSEASTQQVAAVAVAALTDPGLIAGETGGRPLAELPLHLIGHSRGASVVTEMARIFGEQGIWVDQVTSLDPVPLGLNGDAAVRAWQNVLYIDNYWQNAGGFFTPKGTPISGSYNRKLTSFSGGNGSEHSDVHLWYHGTVDLSTPSTSAEADITAAMRSSWWTTAEAEGALAGFKFSRLGGGDRLSAFQPAGGDAVVDGFNGVWDLGAGLVANRSMLPSNSGEWPNVIRCLRSGSGAVAAGQDLELVLYYQAGATATGDVDVEVLLDVDTNPWNGNEVVIDGGVLPKSGTAAVLLDSVAVDPGMTAPGVYFVAARMEDGTKSRVLYVAETVEVVAVMPPMIDGATVRIEGGLMKFTVVGAPGQMVVVEASDDFDGWETVGEMTLSGGSWEFSDGETGMYGERYYRVVVGGD